MSENRFHPVVVAVAKSLLDGHEPGTNPEYERALVEIVLQSAHNALDPGDEDTRREVRELLGLQRWHEVWVSSYVSYAETVHGDASMSGFNWHESHSDAVLDFMATIEAYSDQSVRAWVRPVKVPAECWRTGNTSDVTEFIQSECEVEGDTDATRIYVHNHTD